MRSIFGIAMCALRPVCSMMMSIYYHLNNESAKSIIGTVEHFVVSVVHLISDMELAVVLPDVISFNEHATQHQKNSKKNIAIYKTLPPDKTRSKQLFTLRLVESQISGALRCYRNMELCF